MIDCSSFSASASGRWNVLRPMMEPLAPPSRRAADLLQDGVRVALGFAAGEHDDAPAGEAGLDHVLHPGPSW